MFSLLSWVLLDFTFSSNFYSYPLYHRSHLVTWYRNSQSDSWWLWCTHWNKTKHSISQWDAAECYVCILCRTTGQLISQPANHSVLRLQLFQQVCRSSMMYAWRICHQACGYWLTSHLPVPATTPWVLFFPVRRVPHIIWIVHATPLPASVHQSRRECESTYKAWDTSSSVAAIPAASFRGSRPKGWEPEIGRQK